MTDGREALLKLVQELIADAQVALPVTPEKMREAANHFDRIPREHTSAVVLGPSFRLIAMGPGRYGPLIDELSRVSNNPLMIEWMLFLLMYGFAAAQTYNERLRTMAA